MSVQVGRRVAGPAVFAAVAMIAAGGVSLAVPHHVAAPAAQHAASVPQGPAGHHRKADAYAEKLTRHGPRIAGESRLRRIPRSLKHPHQTIGVTNLIVRKRYWSVSGSPLRVYRALKKAPVSLRLSGYGRPGVGSNGEDYADLFYVRAHPPSYLADAELYVEILGRSNGMTDVAAFAEVVPYPTRHADEVVPAHARVKVSRTWTDKPGRAPLRRVNLTSGKARRLVKAFDASAVSPPGVCVGGPPPTFGYAAEMRAHGHRWQISWTGIGNCDQLGVTRDGKPLPNIETTRTLFRQLKADVAGPDGYIDGGLYKVEGDGLVPLRGTITLSQAGQVVATFDAPAAGPSGSYEFIVAPGSYTLTGSSPDFENGTTCVGQHTAKVRQAHTTRDDVRCSK